jgi:hypothetical protein
LHHLSRRRRLKRHLRKPSPAFVISLVALFVALGGTTYAATGLPANNVGTKQLKNAAVTRSKRSASTFTALKGKRGSQGPQGIQGIQSIQGIQGLKGEKGDTGAPGNDGTARAWAVVDNVGNVSNSHNVTSVVVNGTGRHAVLRR